MRTSLSTIQILHRIGKILSKAAVLISAIAFVFCTATLICTVCGVDFARDRIESTALFGGNFGYAYHLMISLAVIALGEAFVAKRSADYFSSELEAGTPFDSGNATRLRNLGIVTIVIPLVTAVISKTVYAVLVKKYGTFDYSLDYAGGSVAVGIMFIILSLICRYGAEVDTRGKQEKGEQV